MQERQRAKLPTTTLERARDMRSAPTDAEHRLWRQLRGGQLDGLKFRRQHPVPPYIADFSCVALRLIIEIDGSQHGEATDSRRTAYLQAQGFRLLRFNANDVLSNTGAVVEAIREFAIASPLTPTPLPEGEGL